MKLFFCLISLLSFNLYADTCNQHLSFIVKDKSNSIDQVLCNDGYAVGYSYYYKAPIYVQYRLTKENVLENNGRGNNPFKEDSRIPEKFRATLSDYKYSGYDRGHMAPRAAIDQTALTRDESFLMSNMTPQEAKLNQKGWAKLESYVRDLAIIHNEIYVITGSLFEGVNKTIGQDVYVPSHLYKIIYIPGKDKMIAFLIENKAFDIVDLKSKQVKVSYLQNHSGLDFFQNIVNVEEKVMEKSELNYCSILGQGHLKPESCE